MTIELAFRFPLGRMHATPWGENANEGGVEWPPSPWRLLRALYATWKNRAPDLDEGAVLGVLTALAAPPSYVVPHHAVAHTRHYFPGPAHKQAVATDTSKMLDAFVSVDPGDELIVRWGDDLDAQGQATLTMLAQRLTYLGRAESICDVTARFDRTPDNGQVIERSSDADPTAAVSLLVPNVPLDEADLTVTTASLRSKSKRREPPGTTRVRFPKPVPEWGRYDRSSTRPAYRPTAVRWAIAGSALPSKFSAVAWADTLRLAALSSFGKANPGVTPADYPPTLSGKSAKGSTNQGQHRHAHWFAFASPGDRLGDRLLTTLAVWAPDGFDEQTLDALARVSKLYRSGLRDFHSSPIGLEGWGTPADVLPELTGPARRWVSYTPYAPTRHRHNNSGDAAAFLANQIRQELAWRNPQVPDVRVTIRDPAAGGDWHKFRRHRPSREKLAQARRVVGVELDFAEPFSGPDGGPIALGALSHFGLGLFMPME